ncbi:MAG TPA: hypothetical protein VNN80_23235 [Polyangiaceae bacterium]|nr:hypothetical protein [Polyangiaceae bacterium]
MPALSALALVIGWRVQRLTARALLAWSLACGSRAEPTQTRPPQPLDAGVLAGHVAGARPARAPLTGR